MPTTRTSGQIASATGIRGMISRIRSEYPIIAQMFESLASFMSITDERFRSLAQSRPAEQTDPANRIAVDGDYLNDESVTDAKIRSLTADKITAGTIDAGVINVINLNADNITSGTIDASVITVDNIDASNITTGTIDASVIAVTNLDADNITSGQIDASVIDVVNLDADNIVAGTLAVNRLDLLLVVVTGANPRSDDPDTNSIAWDACVVYYDGTAYSVAGGNTNNRAVYWTVAASSFTATNSYTPASNRFLIFTNVNGTLDVAWNKTAASSVTGAVVAPNTLTGGATGNLALNTVIGGASGNIASDTIDAVNLRANSVRANQLVVGNFDNFCEDPGFEENPGDSWTSLFGSFAYSNVDAYSGVWSYRKSTAVTDDEAFNSMYIPCRPGNTFYAEAYGKGTGNGTLLVRISFWDSTKTTRAFTSGSTISATGAFALASVAATVPPGRVFAQISVVVNSHTSGLWYVDDCFIKQRVITAVIEDAAITSAKIGSVDAGTITTGTLAAGRIGAASIDTTKLNIKKLMVFGLSITSGSPSGGITWSSFTIAYDGTSYSISGGNTTSRHVYWSTASPTVVSTGDSYAPSPTVFGIMTNTNGSGDEVWDKPGLGSIQDSNIAGGLIRGIQIQPVVLNQNLETNTTTDTVLLNYTSGPGALFTFGMYVVTNRASHGNLQILLAVTIDGSTAQQFALVDGGYWANSNAWDPRIVMLASDKSLPGNLAGDYMTWYFGLGFSSSCKVELQCNNSGISGGTALVHTSVLYGTKT